VVPAWAPPPRPAWTVPPPSGSPYHRLARTAAHRWWRPVVGTLVLVVGYLLVTVLVLILGGLVGVLTGVRMPVPGEGDRLFGDPVFELAVLLLSIAAVLPLVYGVTWLVQRRPPGTLSSVLGRVRWGWLLLCTAVAFGALVLGQVVTVLAFVIAGEGMTGLFGWVGWPAFLPGLIVTLLLVPFQAAAEEYLFRGWLLQAFGAFMRTPWPGILIGAAAFTALHAYTGWGIVEVFAFGAVMGWLAVRTGGLEAAIALHVINNMLAFGISAAAGSLEEALRQGAVPWQSLAGTVVQLATFTAAVIVLARRRRVDTVAR
jgi:membrane protease YdiL (CAAX protease family)